MLKQFILVAALMVSNEALFAASSFENMIIVPSDISLKAAGKTRAEYNRLDPKAGKEWRDAWSAAGTKLDTRVYVGIRKNTTKPRDAATEKGQ